MSMNDRQNPDGIADPIPCSGSCDWPLCMSNNGTICLFNLPDSYYDDMELSKLNHPSTPKLVDQQYLDDNYLNDFDYVADSPD